MKFPCIENKPVIISTCNQCTNLIGIFTNKCKSVVGNRQPDKRLIICERIVDKTGFSAIMS